MKRKCLFVVLALVIVFGSVSVASAYSCSVKVRASRISNTSAKVTATITANKTLDHCAAQIILQEKYNGSWRTATGVKVTSVSRSKVNFKVFEFPYTFTLVKGKVYRIKAVHVYSDSATQQTRVTHSSVF